MSIAQSSRAGYGRNRVELEMIGSPRAVHDDEQIRTAQLADAVPEYMARGKLAREPSDESTPDLPVPRCFQRNRGPAVCTTQVFPRTVKNALDNFLSSLGKSFTSRLLI